MTQIGSTLIGAMITAGLALIGAMITAALAFRAAERAIRAAAARDRANHRREAIAQITDLLMQISDHATKLERRTRAWLHEIERVKSEGMSRSPGSDSPFIKVIEQVLDAREAFYWDSAAARISMLCALWFDDRTQTSASILETSVTVMLVRWSQLSRVEIISSAEPTFLFDDMMKIRKDSSALTGQLRRQALAEDSDRAHS